MTIAVIYNTFTIVMAIIYNSKDFLNIIKCQSICKRWLNYKNNIYTANKKFKNLNSQFASVITGYHMVNTMPIKESVWEEINCDIVRGVFSIADKANGNHISGKDMKFDNLNISNKSAKTEGNNISISSYRLTTVCNDKNIGDENTIIEEIKKRDKSFEYYSLLLRTEKEKSIIEYKWYIIPKNCYVFNIDKLEPKYGKVGSKKGEIVGWQSKYCDITFSMSSQLWYKFDIKHIEKYEICNTTIDNSNPKITYLQIYESFNNTV